MKTLHRLVLALTLAVGAAAQAQVAPSTAESAAYGGLHAAAWRGDAAAIERLARENKAALEARDGNGRTPLHVATFARQREAVRALIKAGAHHGALHPIGALITGLVAGGLFVQLFTLTQNRWKIDDVLGVWPLHGLCGAWGGIAAGIFGAKALGGMGGVSLTAQVIGTLGGIVIALAGGYLVYGLLRATIGIRLDPEEEYEGADLTIHSITATADRQTHW